MDEVHRWSAGEYKDDVVRHSSELTDMCNWSWRAYGDLSSPPLKHRGTDIQHIASDPFWHIDLKQSFEDMVIVV